MNARRVSLKMNLYELFQDSEGVRTDERYAVDECQMCFTEDELV